MLQMRPKRAPYANRWYPRYQHTPSPHDFDRWFETSSSQVGSTATHGVCIVAKCMCPKNPSMLHMMVIHPSLDTSFLPDPCLFTRQLPGRCHDCHPGREQQSDPKRKLHSSANTKDGLRLILKYCIRRGAALVTAGLSGRHVSTSVSDVDGGCSCGAPAHTWRAKDSLAWPSVWSKRVLSDAF
jgi:hypothetical protein